MTPSGLSRADRRRQTERRILAAARELFAERGFERTTIRAVAAAAEIDPALVMQYFGSKQELFSQAVQVMPVSGGPSPATGPEQVTERLLTSLGMKIGGLPEASLAMLRSMLTHPEAAETARAALNHQIEEVASAIAATTAASNEDARLRAALAITAMVGVTIGHQLLDLDDLRGASPDELAAALRPALRALVTEAG
ncbi:TetR family transcriptional regulator [Streptomyces sp. NPDC005322]|uniref:TetR/AcrR family transcriptional regulator n=1 Tax=unclassified Streptomyces TaxID=2593676 RepID=UPI0033BF4F2F